MRRKKTSVKRRRAPVRLLTLFLAKAGAEKAELLDRRKKPEATEVRVGGKRIGTLYSRPSEGRHPNWVRFFGDAIDPTELRLWTNSAAAALVLAVDGRHVAVTFGYGRYLLNPVAFESTFGLRTTLNCIDHDTIRSIDRKTFEGVTTHVREQASKVTSLAGFGLNVERDLLRAVVGTPHDTALDSRLSGMDALSTSVRVNLDGLLALARTYVAKSEDVHYKSEYPWIDNISEVRDKAVVAELEKTVLARLKQGDFSRMWLAVPDLMDWQDVAGFRYSKSERTPMVGDIHLESYTAQLRDLPGLTTERLRRHRVTALSATTGRPLNQWSLHSCIYAEVDHVHGTHLLNNGAWYAVDRDFVQRIDEVVDAIPELPLGFPGYKDGEAEAKYNRRLAKTLSNATLMDQKNIMYGGGKSRIEFCDVYTGAKQMIHVKRYSGSAVLSHLFAQGAVAGAALVSDASFRKELNKKLPAAFRLKDPLRRPQARHYNVGYVIASASANRLKLPFFSRVTLRNAVRQLSAFGYEVTVNKIAVV